MLLEIVFADPADVAEISGRTMAPNGFDTLLEFGQSRGNTVS